MLENLLATVFLLLTLPVWFVLGVGHGLFSFISEFFDKAWWTFKNIFLMGDQGLDLPNALGATIAIPFVSVWAGVTGFFEVPGSFWNWAVSQHPILIGLIINFLGFQYWYLFSKVRVNPLRR